MTTNKDRYIPLTQEDLSKFESMLNSVMTIVLTMISNCITVKKK